MASSDTVRFAVVFDTHYCLDRDEPMPPGAAEISDKPRYTWMRRHLLPQMLAELQAHAPDFVVCTGDICEGDSRDPALLRRELEGAFAAFAAAGLRILNTRGTHEPGQFYREVALPVFSTALGETVTESYFSFTRGGAWFVIVDYTDLAPGNRQAEWLSEQLAAVPAGAPLFVFAHAPLVPVARPFFSPEPMQQVLNAAFAMRPPSAFFCGHTHNQAFTYHRRGAAGFVQIKGSSVGFPDAPVEPLEERHVLLLGADDTYHWGVPEDQCPGYYLVEVAGETVQAAWHGVGKGVLGTAELSIHGEAPRITRRPSLHVEPLRVADLPLVQQVALEMFMSGNRGGDFEFRLNADCIAIRADCSAVRGAVLGCMAPDGTFAARRWLPLTKPAIRSLAAANEVMMIPGRSSGWILGGVRLVAVTHDGRRLVSKVPTRLLAAGDFAARTGDDPHYQPVTADRPVVIPLILDGE